MWRRRENSFEDDEAASTPPRPNWMGRLLNTPGIGENYGSMGDESESETEVRAWGRVCGQVRGRGRGRGRGTGAHHCRRSHQHHPPPPPPPAQLTDFDTETKGILRIQTSRNLTSIQTTAL